MLGSGIVQVEKRAALEFGGLRLHRFLLVVAGSAEHYIVLFHVRCDCQQVAGVACQSLTDLVHFEDLIQVFLWEFGLQDEKQIFKVSEGIWLKVAEEDYVVVVFKSVAET